MDMTTVTSNQLLVCRDGTLAELVRVIAATDNLPTRYVVYAQGCMWQVVFSGLIYGVRGMSNRDIVSTANEAECAQTPWTEDDAMLLRLLMSRKKQHHTEWRSAIETRLGLHNNMSVTPIIDEMMNHADWLIEHLQNMPAQ